MQLHNKDMYLVQTVIDLSQMVWLLVITILKSEELLDVHYEEIHVIISKSLQFLFWIYHYELNFNINTGHYLCRYQDSTY